MPVEMDVHSRPVGFQLAALPGNEAGLFAVAAMIETSFRG
jgi:hypothetical protein